MDMDGIRTFIIGLVLVSLIGAAGALALDAFGSDQTSGSGEGIEKCGVNGTYAFNISCNGLIGVTNTTNYFGTAGTIAGVALLLTIVIGAFYFVTKENEQA